MIVYALSTAILITLISIIAGIITKKKKLWLSGLVVLSALIYFLMPNKTPSTALHSNINSALLVYRSELNYRQTKNDCGPYNAAAVVRSLTQRNVSSSEFAAQMGWRLPNKYTIPWGVENLLEDNGLVVKTPNVSKLSDQEKISYTQQVLANNKPIILLGKSSFGQHYITLFGFNTTKDEFYIYDSAHSKGENGLTVDDNGELPGNRNFSTSELLDFWRGGGMYGMFTWYMLVASTENKQSNESYTYIDAHPLVESAKKQIGVVTSYDTSYYSGGYPPNDRGACTDVIEQALRENGYDLKAKIDADMEQHPNRYPHDPDPNINYRRVRNVKIFLDNYAKKVSTCTEPKCFKEGIWQPGDIVTFDQIPGSLWHVAIVSNKIGADGVPYLVHNYGFGTTEDDILLRWPAPITGHYRIIEYKS